MIAGNISMIQTDEPEALLRYLDLAGPYAG